MGVLQAAVHPVLGVGPGRYQQACVQALENMAADRRVVLLSRLQRLDVTRFAHNEWLHSFAEVGLAGTIPWNFYALLTLVGVYFTVFTGRVFGPMKTAGQGRGVLAEDEEPIAPTRAIYMWLPLAVMILGALGFMAWTGGGNLRAGPRRRRILHAGLAGLSDRPRAEPRGRHGAGPRLRLRSLPAVLF